MRTDLVDGFRCDRGFQLLNPAYPAVRRHVDVAALDLHAFGRGVEVLTGDGLATVADPLRRPRSLPATLRSGYVRPAELARLARWAAPALGPVPALLSRPDRALAESLDAGRVDGRLRREVLEPFLTGVLADDTGASSATFVRLLLRSFLRATPGVPALGMQALPDQLAALPGRPVRPGTRVRAVRATDGGRGGQRGGPHRARPGGRGGHRPRCRRRPARPAPAHDARPAHLVVRLRRAADRVRACCGWTGDAGAGPVVNTVVMTNAAPSYAPPGRHLVQATTLLRGGAPEQPGDAAETEVRRHLADLYARPTGRWELVVRHDVPDALPLVAPPLRVRQPVDLGGGLFVAGDHRDTSSLQGALVSGARTAQAVRRRLARG